MSHITIVRIRQSAVGVRRGSSMRESRGCRKRTVGRIGSNMWAQGDGWRAGLAQEYDKRKNILGLLTKSKGFTA